MNHEVRYECRFVRDVNEIVIGPKEENCYANWCFLDDGLLSADEVFMLGLCWQDFSSVRKRFLFRTSPDCLLCKIKIAEALYNEAKGVGV
jgi:hypothetical protein